MTTEQARQFTLLLWLGAVGIQFANKIAEQVTASQPSSCTTDYFVPAHKLLAGAIVFTLLGGLAEWVPGLAVALGAGVDLVVLLGPVAGANQQGNTVFDRIVSVLKATS